MSRFLKALALALAPLLFAGAVLAAGVPMMLPANGITGHSGDSWTDGNETVRSRYPATGTCTGQPCSAVAGIIQPLDNWVEQLPALTNHASFNFGLGGQTSSRVYNNIESCVLSTTCAVRNALAGPAFTVPIAAQSYSPAQSFNLPGPTLLAGNWTWWAGRNDITKPGGAIYPQVADGTYSTTFTCTLTSGSASVTGCSPNLSSIGGGGGLNGFAVSGTGVQALTYVSGDTLTTTFTMTKTATASGAQTLTLASRGATQFLSLIPHGRKALFLPNCGLGISTGLADWVRCQRLKWTYRSTHAQYLFEVNQFYDALSPNGSDGQAANDLLVKSGELPGNCNINGHPNYQCTPSIAAGVAKLIKGMNGTSVYALDRTIPYIPYDIGAGATIGQLYGYGNITSWALTTNDCSGCIGVSSGGLVTKVGGARLPIVHATATLTGKDAKGNTVTSVANLRILNTIVGAASSVPIGATLPLDPDATASSKRWPRLSMFDGAIPDSSKFSFAICLKPDAGIDGVNANIAVGSSSFIINKGPTNKFVITMRDTSNGLILSSWTSVTTNYTSANGYQWFFFSLDISGAGVISAWSVDSAGTRTNIAPATAPTVGSGVIRTSFLGNYFVASSTGASSYGGAVKVIYFLTGTAIDWSNATNTQKFVNSSGVAQDLGPNCATPTGSQPDDCEIGAEGDYVTGKSFVTALPDKGWNDTWLLGFATSSDPTAP